MLYLEHHINLGFEFFYSTVDNLVCEQIDYYDYILPIYKDKVMILNMNKEFASKIWLKNMNNGIYDQIIWIDFFNNIVFP